MNNDVTVQYFDAFTLYIPISALALVELIEGGGGLWWCKINPVTP